jgi:hypothetical protein
LGSSCEGSRGSDRAAAVQLQSRAKISDARRIPPRSINQKRENRLRTRSPIADFHSINRLVKNGFVISGMETGFSSESATVMNSF